MRTVQPGVRFDNLWQIDSGLAEDETVVVEGLQKIRDGVLAAPTPFHEAPPDPTNTANAGATDDNEVL